MQERGIDMTRKEIKNKVVEIIADKIGIPVCEIYENTRFKEDFGTDSLDDIELLVEFERTFGIKIPDEETATICTVGEAIDGICQKLGVPICKQQQLEVDLKKEIEEEWKKIEKDYSPSALDKSYMIVSGLIGKKQFSRIAHYFYELGFNAKI